MKFVIQRVLRAAVTIDENETREISEGLMVLAGIGREDTAADVEWMARKLINLRIFEDDEGKMNLSVKDIDGEIMIVSQFTLYATTKKGNRPGFTLSAPPEQAVPLYEKLLREVGTLSGREPAAGKFGASMRIDLVNNGPVTIILDSKNQE
ncbi:MAG: D-tyrosyl-tRNA(Tyr) deacylase [Spirochaetales bacterium]|nr:D-tyrosyl-tRNA(Tyr) deacylase [Spirochaetales bacterium]